MMKATILLVFINCASCKNLQYFGENANENEIAASESCKESADCAGNQVCVNNFCDCESGKAWNKRRDECRALCTNHDDCQIFERCITGYREKFCDCPRGKSGERCEDINECFRWHYRNCKGDNGQCAYNDEKEAAYCNCSNGKTWSRQYENCLIPCKDDCSNHGECEGEGKDRFCKCKPGTSGDLCSVVDDCSSSDLCGHIKNAHCVYDGIRGGTCVCQDGLLDTTTNKCRIPCKDDCANNGECETVGNNKFCKCKPGTSGDLCTIVDDCANKVFCGTTTEVKCVYDEIKNAAVCKCDDPMKHYDPKSRECRRGVCSNYKCQNGGICTEDDSGNAKCYCSIPFSGEWCEKDMRYLSVSVLVLIVLVLLIIICGGCYLFKMKQKMSQN